MKIKPNTIFNVLVNGFSIGLTFDYNKAASWARESFSRDKRIVAVPYAEPQGLTYAVAYHTKDS